VHDHKPAVQVARNIHVNLQNPQPGSSPVESLCKQHPTNALFQKPTHPSDNTKVVDARKWKIFIQLKPGAISIGPKYLSYKALTFHEGFAHPASGNLGEKPTV
jgi:hypothetical protein